MGAAATIALAFSMSMDAFAASLGKGAALHHPPLREAFRTGLIFGVVEAATPILGWMVGVAAAAWITQIDHWVAFILLGVIGGRMAFKALARGEADQAPARHSLGVLGLTALATSLDAMAVGVTLAFIKADILTTATAIGLATFLMAALGMATGRWIGPMCRRIAEFVGGICLVAIGTTTLIEHTLGG